MAWQIAWTPRAEKTRERLDRKTRARILAAVEGLAADPGSADIRKLEGHADQWRLRVGRWRVRFTFDATIRSIVILHVLPRSTAYRD